MLVLFGNMLVCLKEVGYLIGLLIEFILFMFIFGGVVWEILEILICWGVVVGDVWYGFCFF